MINTLAWHTFPYTIKFTHNVYEHLIIHNYIYSHSLYTLYSLIALTWTISLFLWASSYSTQLWNVTKDISLLIFYVVSQYTTSMDVYDNITYNKLIQSKVYYNTLKNPSHFHYVMGTNNQQFITEIRFNFNLRKTLRIRNSIIIVKTSMISMSFPINVSGVQFTRNITPIINFQLIKSDVFFS